MAGNKVKIDITVDAKKGTSDIKKFTKDTKSSMGKVEKAGVSSARKMGKAWLAVGTVVAGTVFVAVRAMKDFYQAALQQDLAIKGLNVALQGAGRYTPEFSAQLQHLASSLQQTTNFGDETTLAGIKMLTMFKGISNKELPRTTKAMLNLSAAMGIDMQTAAKAFGMASEGNLGQLSRYIGTIDKARFETEGFTYILELLEQKVGGQAEAMVDPFKQLSNAAGDVKEQIGFLIQENLAEWAQAGVRYLTELVKWFNEIRLQAAQQAIEDTKLEINLMNKELEEGIEIFEAAEVMWTDTQSEEQAKKKRIEVQKMNKVLIEQEKRLKKIQDAMKPPPTGAAGKDDLTGTGLSDKTKDAQKGLLGKLAAENKRAQMKMLEDKQATIQAEYDLAVEGVNKEIELARSKGLLTTEIEKEFAVKKNLIDEGFFKKTIDLMLSDAVIQQDIQNQQVDDFRNAKEQQLALAHEVHEATYAADQRQNDRFFASSEEKLLDYQDFINAEASLFQTEYDMKRSFMEEEIRNKQAEYEFKKALGELTFGEEIARAEELKALKDNVTLHEMLQDQKVAENKAKVNKMKEDLQKQDLDATKNHLSGALAIMAKGNKTAFRAQKAIAIGKAIMAGIEAAVHSFNWGASWGGPIAGGIMAALSLGATAIYVQNIRKQQQPEAAEGGVFTGPKSGFAATLHGTEAVVPLPNGRSIPVEGGGGGGVMNINISATDSQSFVDLVARNPEAITGPIVEQLQLGNRNLISTIQDTTREE